MTILFLSWEYPPHGSGIGRYVDEMSAALRAAGHFIVVLTSRGPGLPERTDVDGGIILRLFDRAELRSSAVATLAATVARQYEVDWIEAAEHWGEGATLLRLPNRPPVVVKMHYNDVLKTSRYAQAWYPWQRYMIDLACLRQWRTLRAERYSIEQADVLQAPCQRMLDEARHQGLSLPRRCAVVPNPIRSLPGWGNREAEAPTLLWVGRLDIGKGLPYLRNLLERLTPDFPGLRLEIAGADSYARGLGTLRKWLENQLGGMHRYVHFLGVLGVQDLDDAYRRAWVVIVPSRWDTFSTVVLEAMVRGKPIVASPHGGAPEMLEGTSCVVADPLSAGFVGGVADLLSDPARRHASGLSARVRAELAYAPATVADTYVGVMNKDRGR